MKNLFHLQKVKIPNKMANLRVVLVIGAALSQFIYKYLKKYPQKPLKNSETYR
jgi:hypothetical protein